MSQIIIGRLKDELDALRSDEGMYYAGLPTYKAFFGRDSLITAMELLDYDRNNAISTIQLLKNFQGQKTNLETMEETGKIFHEMQIDKALVSVRSVDVPWLKAGVNYFSIDSTPLFLILGTLLYQRGKKFLEDEGIRDSFIFSAQWLMSQMWGKRYLSFSKPSKGKGLQTQSWRDGSGDFLDSMISPLSVIGVQGYAYSVFSQSLEFLRACGATDEFLEKMSEMAENMKSYIFKDFNIPGLNYPALAMDGKGKLNKSITSDPGHLIFSGILEKDQEESVIGYLMGSDLFTEYGIRTLSVTDPAFDPFAYQRGSVWPHDNWIIACGLRKRGYKSEYDEIKNRILAISDAMDGLPEYVGVDEKGVLINPDRMKVKSCKPQSWSTGAEIFFRTH